jgi:uncharacterized protein (TIGR00290 family)
MTKPRAYVSWSSGKDAAFALMEVRRLGTAEIVGILTTVNEVHDRVAMHGVRSALLDRQIAALGLPCVKVPIPFPCPNDVYEERMADAVAGLRAEDVHHMIFGDLFLEDIRAYRDERLAKAGMQGIYPLWGRNTVELADTMIASGIEARIACLDPARVDPALAGRPFDRTLLASLPEGVDPCGENGEFHTVVTGGPLYAAPIPVTGGAVVERDGFVYADVIPV